MTTTRLSSKGQVVIPKAIRDAQGWTAGADLVIEQRSGEVVLKRATQEKIYTIADLKGMLKYDGPPKTLEEMDAGVDEAMRERWARKRGREPS